MNIIFLSPPFLPQDSINWTAEILWDCFVSRRLLSSELCLFCFMALFADLKQMCRQIQFTLIHPSLISSWVTPGSRKARERQYDRVSSRNNFPLRKATWSIDKSYYVDTKRDRLLIPVNSKQNHSPQLQEKLVSYVNICCIIGNGRCIKT